MNILQYKSFKLIVAALLSATLIACGGQDNSADEVSSTSDNSLQAIKDRGVLKVAVFGDKPPFGYVDEAGSNQGYDVELAKRLAKDLLGDENKIEFVITEAQNRVDVLKSNKVDITLANFTLTPERAEQVDFAEPYMKTAIGLVSPISAPITSIEELKGQKLLVNKGTTAEIYFATNNPEVELLRPDYNTETFNALLDGRAVALAHDNTLLYAWVKNNPSFAVTINEIGDRDVIAPAVKKGGTELLEWINQEITSLNQEKFFTSAYDKSIKPFYGEGIEAKNVVLDQ